MKIKWTVSPAPTGRYRSFFSRAWPSASFECGSYAAVLSCVDEYVPSRVRSGDHAEIKITVALHGVKPPEEGLKTVVLKRRAKTLDEAKSIVLEFYGENPKYTPKESDKK